MLVIQPVEHYPHTLGIVAWRRKGGAQVEDFVPLVEAGRMKAGQALPSFAQNLDGSALVVDVQRQGFGRLPVSIQLDGTGELWSLNAPESEYPPRGRYHVGLIVDRSNLGSLVFEPVDGGEKKVYNLGNVNPAFVVEER